jgi:transcriptional regulator with XRE-family HTH domain/DNA-binding transcriptional regulator YiaG
VVATQVAMKKRASRTAPEKHVQAQSLDFEAISREWVRALRGKRSQASFSRRLGFASSVAHRWETGAAWPTAARFLEACERSGKNLAAAYATFFWRPPSWLGAHAPSSPEAVAALLRQLRGKTKNNVLAEASGYSRYSIARWMKGEAEPRLPEFLRLIEASSRRALDFISTLQDPASLPSAEQKWARLTRMRQAAYEESWSHAVLRALELDEYVQVSDSNAWLASVLGIDAAQLVHALAVLERTGQIARVGEKWAPLSSAAVTTGADPMTRGLLTRAWMHVADQRIERGAPGHFGYSLFAASRADLRRLRELHMAYLREMQSIIARSSPNECVGLLCLQLLDLSEREDNALAGD